MSKRFPTAGMLTVVDTDGCVLRGDRPPSTEVLMRLRVYAEDARVGAVVHAHPIYATAFAIKGERLVGMMMPESVVALPEVPLAPYATPSTREVPDSVAPFVTACRACLLERHGALTWGEDLMAAYLVMERLEYTAQLTTITRALNGERFLSPERVEEIRRVFGMPRVAAS